MAASAVAQQQRMENTVATLPIVYGSIAFPLPAANKKGGAAAAAPSVDSTHEWTLYLRGPNNEDLSLCIQKAVFHLHPSFAKPVRELTKPPYEVTERGWGEFEAQIRISWKDPNEAITVVTHGIKLYPPPVEDHPRSESDPVVAESYDEVVFTNPTESFFDQLRRVPEAPAVTSSMQSKEHFPKQQHYSDADNVLALLEANKFLQHELEGIKGRLLRLDRELEVTDEALRVAQEKADSEAAAAALPQATAPQRKSATKSGRNSAGPASKKAKTAAAAGTTI